MIDHRKAAPVPTVIRVSMVTEPCRALSAVARWKGQPAHTITGGARVSEAKPQYSKCRDGIIAIAITGNEQNADPITPWRHLRRSGASPFAPRTSVYPMYST